MPYLLESPCWRRLLIAAFLNWYKKKNKTLRKLLNSERTSERYMCRRKTKLIELLYILNRQGRHSVLIK